MESEIKLPTTNDQVLAVKSWTAYVKPVLTNGIILLIGIGIAAYANGLGLLTALVALGRLVYQFLYLRSYKLFQDDMGIWYYRGVFPWNKGTAGVKWRDLDEAVFFNSLTSWLFKSFTIRIGHRFTKGAEIRLDHMRAGDVVVQHINGHHQRLVAANALS